MNNTQTDPRWCFISPPILGDASQCRLFWGPKTKQKTTFSVSVLTEIRSQT
jgi:hypothetical protein